MVTPMTDPFWSFHCLELLPMACRNCSTRIRQGLFEQFLSGRADLIKKKIASHRKKNPDDKTPDEDLYMRIAVYRNIYIDFWAYLKLGIEVDMEKLYNSCDKSEEDRLLLIRCVEAVKSMRICCKSTWMSNALSVNGVHFRPTFPMTKVSLFEQICDKLNVPSQV